MRQSPVWKPSSKAIFHDPYDFAARSDCPASTDGGESNRGVRNKEIYRRVFSGCHCKK